VPPDEPHQRGDSNLLETNNLSTIAAHVLGGGLLPADYQSRVLCLTDWRRKGSEYDLAPLARQFPSSNRPEFKHISKATFEASFALAPGGLKLTEVRPALQKCRQISVLAARPSLPCNCVNTMIVSSLTGKHCCSQAEKGDLQPTNLGGFGAPSATAGGSGRSGGTGGAPAAGGTKIKLKVKANKGEKVRRSWRCEVEAGCLAKHTAEASAFCALPHRRCTAPIHAAAARRQRPARVIEPGTLSQHLLPYTFHTMLCLLALWFSRSAVPPSISCCLVNAFQF
jgi:hypothetical protein